MARFWHESGAKKSEITYDEGVPAGPVVEWTEDGKLVRGGTRSEGKESASR